jgi:hypothetical protein
MGRAFFTHGSEHVYTGFCWETLKGKNINQSKTFRSILKGVGLEGRGLDSSGSQWG